MGNSLNHKNRIAVLIVNWNKEKDVLNLLSDLRKIKTNFFDVFVVDNASTDQSVRSIRHIHPGVVVLVNPENLGGTGGFNSGLEIISRKPQYEYIWLLDNDARITDITLQELIRAMDEDKNIGVAGSRIQDIDAPDMVVETGANFCWDRMGVIPVNRNKKGNPTQTITVDYVAICSALVRVSAMKKTGLMDRRFFLYWDDMDWGLSFKKKGYKVVAVGKSIAYHGSFTERDRGAVTTYYYGTRNALLTYSKHTPGRKRALLFLNGLRTFLKRYFFLRFHGYRFEAGLIKKALLDFYVSNWGKIDSDKLKQNRPMSIPPINSVSLNRKRILVSLAGTSFQTGMEIIKGVETYFPNAKIDLLIADDRENYFKAYSKKRLKTQSANRMTYLLNCLLSLYKSKFDYVATATPVPFIYAAPEVIFYNAENKTFFSQKSGLLNAHKAICANLLGECVSAICFPFILHKSIKYKRQSSLLLKS